MIRTSGAVPRKVLVMGLGRHGGGWAALLWFARQGSSVVVQDSGEAAQFGDLDRRLEAEGLDPRRVRLRFGAHDPADFDTADVVVVNPAVPFQHPLVQRAARRGAEIVTELGLTLRRWRGPLACITGTKGKSTTTALLAAMLEAAGMRALAGGNIGRPLLNEDAADDPDAVAVLEVSSFQLAWLEHTAFAPRVAVVTNVSGDHLDRHGTFEHYARSKERLVRVLGEGATAVLNADDSVCRRFEASLRSGVRVRWFGSGREPPLALRLRLRGEHNALNAVAAAHAALALGADPASCARAAAAFEPLAHRLETVATRGGVEWVNDSIATTPHAVERAVASFRSPVLLLVGGRDKGADWDPLVRAAGRARVVFAFGETGPELKRRIPGVHLCEDLGGAVAAARARARPGDTVLLSPGFASFDQFRSFEERGERFREQAAAGDPGA